ncbi:hypothetical protein GCM10028805_48120 [Spirosoma harenae]
MPENSTINTVALYSEIASIAASSLTSFELQLKDLSKAEQVYWKNKRRKVELDILIKFLTPDGEPKPTDAPYEKLIQERYELSMKLLEYYSENP